MTPEGRKSTRTEKKDNEGGRRRQTKQHEKKDDAQATEWEEAAKRSPFTSAKKELQSRGKKTGKEHVPLLADVQVHDAVGEAALKG